MHLRKAVISSAQAVTAAPLEAPGQPGQQQQRAANTWQAEEASTYVVGQRVPGTSVGSRSTASSRERSRWCTCSTARDVQPATWSPWLPCPTEQLLSPTSTIASPSAPWIVKQFPRKDGGVVSVCYAAVGVDPAANAGHQIIQGGLGAHEWQVPLPQAAGNWR